MPVTPAMLRDNSGTIQAAASRLISKVAETAAQAVAHEKCDANRDHDQIVVKNIGCREQAAGRQRRGLEFECGIAPPQPGETCSQHQRQRDLHRIGEGTPRAPHPRRPKMPTGFSPSRYCPARAHGCVKFMESAKACQTPPPSVAKLSASSATTVATAAAIVRHRPPASKRDRNQDAELRLVGEAAEQQAR